MPQAFKACHVRDGRFFSYVDVLKEAVPETRLEYKLNEWTEPVIPNSCLFTFRDKYDAERFPIHEGYEDEFKVFECEIEEVIELNCTYVVNLGLESLYRFWATRYSEFGPLSVPYGAIGCKKVKLVREVSTINNGVVQSNIA